MIDRIKELFQVQVNCIFVTQVNVILTFLQSFMGTKTGTKTKTIGMKLSLINWRKHLGNGLLDNTVNNSGDTQLTLLTIIFGYFYPTNRIRGIIA